MDGTLIQDILICANAHLKEAVSIGLLVGLSVMHSHDDLHDAHIGLLGLVICQLGQ